MALSRRCGVVVGFAAKHAEIALLADNADTESGLAHTSCALAGSSALLVHNHCTLRSHTLKCPVRVGWSDYVCFAYGHFTLPAPPLWR